MGRRLYQGKISTTCSNNSSQKTSILNLLLLSCHSVLMISNISISMAFSRDSTWSKKTGIMITTRLRNRVKRAISLTKIRVVSRKTARICVNRVNSWRRKWASICWHPSKVYRIRTMRMKTRTSCLTMAGYDLMLNLCIRQLYSYQILKKLSYTLIPLDFNNN